jgi:hypothetical protein
MALFINNQVSKIRLSNRDAILFEHEVKQITCSNERTENLSSLSSGLPTVGLDCEIKLMLVEQILQVWKKWNIF